MAANGDSHIRFIPLPYTPEDSEGSALALVRALRPTWARVEFKRFTDGITNTLLKAVDRSPGVPADAADREAILLRAYGRGTDVIIDRLRETQNHELLMRHGLAPELLARFENGMLYRFVRGTVTQPEDLRRPDISRAIARRLAQWHVTVPCLPRSAAAKGPHVNGTTTTPHANGNGHENGNGHARGGGNGVENGDGNGHKHADDDDDDDDNDSAAHDQALIDAAAPGKPAPNLWTVMQKWILALPTDTEDERARRADLQRELERLVGELSARPGLGRDGLVFAHTDLLSGNVIVLPPDDAAAAATDPTPSGDVAVAAAAKGVPSVTFIDYEYAVPSPAAFDIANHFAEWGGFDCDMAAMPTAAQRRLFVAEYVRAYRAHLPDAPARRAFDEDREAAHLAAEVDLFRGVPGFYWGVWALIQARISHIDFDYASYAQSRLGEYWAWRAEHDGSRARSGREIPLRERRWAQES